jgi:hypothetical protein
MFSHLQDARQWGPLHLPHAKYWGLFLSTKQKKVSSLVFYQMLQTQASFHLLGSWDWSFFHNFITIMNKILPTKYDLIHHNLYLHNILTLKTFKQIIYMSEKMNLFIIPEFHRQEETSNLLENRITAWLWSEPFNPFDCCWSHWKLSLRLRDRWNFTNSTLTLRESFRSLSANGDHCASFKPRSVNDMTRDLSKIVSWSPAGGTHACFNILYLGSVQITTFQPSSVFLEKWRKRVIMTLTLSSRSSSN